MSQNPNPTLLDQNQILQRSFDEDNDRLRVDATVTASLGETKITDGSVDATITTNSGKNGLDVNVINDLIVDVSHTTDSIRVGDGTSLVTATNVGGNVGLDVNVLGGSVTGAVQSKGLSITGKVTTMMVSTSALALPPSPLSQRNSLSITNLSNQTLYIGFDTSVTPDDSLGTTAGWEIGPNEGFNIDIQGTIPIYGIVASGSIKIKIMELA